MSSYQKLLIAQRREAREAAVGTPPAQQGVRARAICIECVHHTCDFDMRAEKIVHACSHPALRHPVTGRPTDPFTNRLDEKGCGRSANYWQAAPVRRARVEREVFAEAPATFSPPVAVRQIAGPELDETVVVLWERKSP